MNEHHEAPEEFLITLARAIRYAIEHRDRDPDLAVYMLRDFPFLRQIKLSDLAWAYSKDGNVYPNEVDDFLELVLVRLDGKSLLELAKILRQQTEEHTKEDIERAIAERKRAE